MLDKVWVIKKLITDNYTYSCYETIAVCTSEEEVFKLIDEKDDFVVEEMNLNTLYDII